MKHIGTFQSVYGKVNVFRTVYGGELGKPLAIVLELENGEPLATLSVNMYTPECSHDSTDLPADCFYVKCWGENEALSAEALAGGLFIERKDLPRARSGFVTAPVWQIKAPV
jgi:hypothetical protein